MNHVFSIILHRYFKIEFKVVFLIKCLTMKYLLRYERPANPSSFLLYMLYEHIWRIFMKYYMCS